MRPKVDIIFLPEVSWADHTFFWRRMGFKTWGVLIVVTRTEPLPDLYVTSLLLTLATSFRKGRRHLRYVLDEDVPKKFFLIFFFCSFLPSFLPHFIQRSTVGEKELGRSSLYERFFLIMSTFRVLFSRLFRTCRRTETMSTHKKVLNLNKWRLWI